MKIQISLSSAPQWVIPSEADLRLEYRYEYNLPQRNWKQRCKTIGAYFPLFESEDDFVKRIQTEARVITLTRNDYVHNLTSLKSIEEIEDLVSGYAYPRDVKRIVEGLTNGAHMPMPIIIKGMKGMWILSGNTRQNVAQVLRVRCQALVLDAP